MRSLAMIVVLGGCHATPRPIADESVVLEHLIARTPIDDPQRPDLDFRLADTLERRGEHARAVQAFRAIVDEPRWRDYARRDQVLFWYAHALGTAESVAVIHELVTAYPKSKLRGVALLVLADAQYDRGDVAGALASYTATAFLPDDDRAWYARYRIAWCHRALGNTSLATSELEAIADARPSGPRSRTIVAAARKDLGETDYTRADALYAAKDFCAAAPLYASVARSDPFEPRRTEAAYAHVLATVSCEHLDADQPGPLSPASQRVLAAIELYLARVPHAPERAAVEFRHARILFGVGHLADAALEFRDVVRIGTDDELLGAAAALLLDCDHRAQRDALAADLLTVCALHVAKTGDLAHVCESARPR